MMNWIVKTAIKFLSYDALVELIAKAIAYILEYARKHASEGGWEKAKTAVKQIKNSTKFTRTTTLLRKRRRRLRTPSPT